MMVAGLLSFLAMGQAALLPAGRLNISAVDIAGATRSLPVKGASATVVFFVMRDCPIANRLAPEISRICEDYKKRNVATFVCYVDKGSTAKDIEEHQKQYGYDCPAFLDSNLKLARKLGPQVSPEAIVLDRTGRMRYRGRVNDLYSGHGEVREKAKTNDLRDALDAILSGKKIERPVVPAVGCFISYR